MAGVPGALYMPAQTVATREPATTRSASASLNAARWACSYVVTVRASFEYAMRAYMSRARLMLDWATAMTAQGPTIKSLDSSNAVSRHPARRRPPLDRVSVMRFAMAWTSMTRSARMDATALPRGGVAEVPAGTQRCEW